VNGIQYTLSGTAGSVNVNTDELRIGEDFHANNDRYLHGEIDEVRVWGAALNITDIRNWMCRMVTNSHPNWAECRVYMRFDDTTGTLVKDRSDFQNYGTLTNGPLRVWSGAAIGDTARYTGSSLPTSRLRFLRNETTSARGRY
jgi:hypothetical protein